jgi:hypothetical protein
MVNVSSDCRSKSGKARLRALVELPAEEEADCRAEGEGGKNPLRRSTSSADGESCSSTPPARPRRDHLETAAICPTSPAERQLAEIEASSNAECS